LIHFYKRFTTNTCPRRQFQRTMESASEPSLVVKFDELVRRSQVLQTSCEDQFLRFVINASLNRRSWEHAELECQRLSLELTKASREISGLEHKLSHARTMLDNELRLRKNAESERDRLLTQLTLLRQLVMDDHLVDEVKLNKLRSFGNCDLNSADDLFSPSRITPKGILKNLNRTEESVRDVEDFSFDETRELCDSRSRLSRSGARKRSRSANLDENMMEVQSPKLDKLPTGKRSRRSRSIVGFADVPVETVSEDRETRPRLYSAVHFSDPTSSPTPSSAHSFIQKTFVKAEKCSVCNKRIKFGKIGMKCTRCRAVNHAECSDRVLPFCSNSGSPDVLYTPSADRNRSPTSKKQFFSSPMLK